MFIFNVCKDFGWQTPPFYDYVKTKGHDKLRCQLSA